MLSRLNRLLDVLSDFLAVRKGLLPLLGILLIIVNGILQFIPTIGWLAHTNLLFHIVVI